MNPTDWVFPIIAAVLALAILWISLRKEKGLQLIAGITVSLLGFALILQVGLQSYLPVESIDSVDTLTKKPLDLPKEKPALYGNFLTLSLPGSSPEPRKLDLAHKGLSIESQLAAESLEKSSTWFIFDASIGVQPEYLPWLEQNFGKLSEISSDASASQVEVERQTGISATQEICWQRTKEFFLATPHCVSRPVKYFLEPAQGDLARNSKGQATVRVRVVNEKSLVLITHAIPEKPSREEACLLGLASGQLCAAVELLPGQSVEALSFSTQDSVNEQVLEEFGLSQKKDVASALKVYSELDLPKIRLFPESTSQCQGFSESADEFRVSELNRLTQFLENVENESEMSREIRTLLNQSDCPGLRILELPRLKFRNPRSGARSLLRQILDKPIWMTTPTSYLYRARKTDRVELGKLEQSKGLDLPKIWIRTPDRIRKLGLTIMSPVTFPEEILVNLGVEGASDYWRVYSFGASAFRVVFEQTSGEASIDLKKFVQSLNQPQIGFRGLLATTGFLPSLLLAYILGALLAFVQAVSPGSRKRTPWIFSFAAVTFIGFVLVFASYYSARQPFGLGETSVLNLETPREPSHLFLREWPESWFETTPQNLPATAGPDLRPKTAKWVKALTTAEAEAKQASTAGALPRLTESYLGFEVGRRSFQNPKSVVIWDHPRARNFYFRRSPTYQSSLLSWSQLTAQNNSAWRVSTAGSALELNLQAVGFPRFVPGDFLILCHS